MALFVLLGAVKSSSQWVGRTTAVWKNELADKLVRRPLGNWPPKD